MRLIRGRALVRLALLGILGGVGLSTLAQDSRQPIIQVVDDDGRAVNCVIVLVKQNGSEIRLGTTGISGRFILAEPCQRGEQIRAQPESPKYYRAHTECPVETERGIKVTKRIYLANLKHNASRLEKNDQPAKAALVYSEIASRAVVFDQGESQAAMTKSLILMGAALGVESPVTFDRDRGQYVASSELRVAIVVFQQEQGLTVSGNLDYATLSSAANSAIGPYIFNSIDDPPRQ